MAEVILKARVEVSGLGDDIDVSARGTNTLLEAIGHGYQTCGTAVVVASAVCRMAVSEVLGYFIQAEVGTIYCNPVCTVGTLVSAVGGVTTYCTITAPNFLVLNYSAHTTFVTMRGSAAGDGLSYVCYGTASA